jgi:hypothetical protein
MAAKAARATKGIWWRLPAIKFGLDGLCRFSDAAASGFVFCAQFLAKKVEASPSRRDNVAGTPRIETRQMFHDPGEFRGTLLSWLVG